MGVLICCIIVLYLIYWIKKQQQQQQQTNKQKIANNTKRASLRAKPPFQVVKQELNCEKWKCIYLAFVQLCSELRKICPVLLN